MRQKNLWIYWLIAFGIVGLLLWLSGISNLRPFQDIKFPPWIAEIIQHSTVTWGANSFFAYGVSLHPDYLLHKIGHVVLYGALGFCLFRICGRMKWALIIALVMAGLDEWRQWFVPGRTGSFWDILLDVAAAWSAVKLFGRRKTRARRIDIIP